MEGVHRTRGIPATTTSLFVCLFVQAVHHLRQAARLSKETEEKANSLHLLGGALKDLKRLDEAQQVCCIYQLVQR